VVATAELSAIEVTDYVAERVAPYKKVRAVEFIDQIPRSLSGKILRRVLMGPPSWAETRSVNHLHQFHSRTR
jgi:acyl-coenzyme A synthetase/AMP-(fatty) acid ligase